jgi:hypothetical protein
MNKSPIPGQAKIVSMTTAPLTKVASSSPRTVTIGIAAFFRACRVTMLRRLRPFASSATT